MCQQLNANDGWTLLTAFDGNEVLTVGQSYNDDGRFIGGKHGCNYFVAVIGSECTITACRDDMAVNLEIFHQ